MPLFRAVWATALIVGAAMRLSGQEQPVNIQPVDLPDFVVESERELPPPEPWLYTRLGNHEILSSASRGPTERMLKDLNRLVHALQVLKTPFLPPEEASAKVLVCGREADFQAFAEKFGDQNAEDHLRTWHYEFRGRDGAVLVLDQTAPTIGLFDDRSDDESTEVTLAEQRTADYTRRLQTAFVKFLLYQQQPAMPAWLAEGLARSLVNVRVTERSVTWGVVDDPNKILGGVDERPAGHATPATMLTRQKTPSRDSLNESLDFNAALASSALMPLGEMFSWQRDTYIGKQVLAIRWFQQSYAFVHWGLFGDLGRHQKQFLAFTRRLEKEPASETLFRECFGLSYAQGLTALRTHIESVRAKVVGVEAEKGARLPEAAPIEVRDATPAEIARLKFTAYTLAEMPDRAHNELVLAYRRGERTPNLVAELGVSALKLGQRDRARNYLTLATKAKTTRTRAYVTLAQMRLEERLAKPQGADGKLSYEQLLGVLEPLILARAQAPRSLEVYTLFAEAWAKTAATPPAQHLALVDEGVKLFPENAALREARARLGPTATVP